MSENRVQISTFSWSGIFTKQRFLPIYRLDFMLVRVLLLKTIYKMTREKIKSQFSRKFFKFSISKEILQINVVCFVELEINFCFQWALEGSLISRSWFIVIFIKFII